MKHCCVIGGAGFIGTYLVQELLTRNRRVTIIGRNATPSFCFPDTVRYVCGDYGDEDLLSDILNDVEEIVHLAYSTVPKTSYDDPILDIQNNLPATATLLKVASSLEMNRIVFVSSGGTIYGKARVLPISEDHITNPISPYGITKLAVEKYALMYHELKSLPVVCVRPANAYGEGQRPFVGQGFIATVMASILEQKEIVLYGKEGTVRDYVHVADVVAGIVAAMEKGRNGTCYNIGSGIGFNNQEVLEEIFIHAKKVGCKPKVVIMPSRDFDVPVNVLDTRRLFLDTGWHSTIDLKTGIKRTWDWFYKGQKW